MPLPHILERDLNAVLLRDGGDALIELDILREHPILIVIVIAAHYRVNDEVWNTDEPRELDNVGKHGYYVLDIIIPFADGRVRLNICNAALFGKFIQSFRKISPILTEGRVGELHH